MSEKNRPLYARLDTDVSGKALECIQEALERYLAGPIMHEDIATRQDLLNLANECRARVQHIEAGMEETVLGRSAEQEWLDE